MNLSVDRIPIVEGEVSYDTLTETLSTVVRGCIHIVRHGAYILCNRDEPRHIYGVAVDSVRSLLKAHLDFISAIDGVTHLSESGCLAYLELVLFKRQSMFETQSGEISRVAIAYVSS
jgi:hypothetical protein